MPKDTPGAQGLGPGASVVIRDYDRLPPFLMTVVSATDLWMFLSSTGALTAGRGTPSGALFPYTTDDKLHDAEGISGPFCALAVPADGGTRIWRPFDGRGREDFELERRLVKGVTCDWVEFEERNLTLGLSFRYRWEPSDRFGWVRRVWLSSQRSEAVNLRCWDGLRNVMPASANLGMQGSLSTLLDAYRQAELVEGTDLALLRLNSIPIDQPQPNESLLATTVYGLGAETGTTLLSDAQLPAFLAGSKPRREPEVRALRGVYALAQELCLEPSETRSWSMVMNGDQDGAQVLELAGRLTADAGGLAAEIEASIQADRLEMQELVSRADGSQLTASPAEDARHYANTLFNIMRGGTFAGPGDGLAENFSAHLRRVAPAVAERHGALLRDLPGPSSGPEQEPLSRERFIAILEGTGDLDLRRLGVEYLPLTFSRRHGDPSRPWNSFAIPGRGADGRRVLGYEGNWRDIFQNWEALGCSYPGFAQAMVTRFLNASTADGYNPYRIHQAGVDWEVHDPEDPWSFIGYWGDHQVDYLARLVDLLERYEPGSLSGGLNDSGYVSVDVPYRIAGFDAIWENPKSTIEFDEALAARIDERVEDSGNEGRLLCDAEGRLVHVTLAEKLLTPLLVKLTNLVPGGGIWMNTQRPEWNDANNALAGFGLSVVTTAYLDRALRLWAGLFEDSGAELQLSSPVAELLDGLAGVLGAAPPEGEDARARRRATEELGRLGEAHRTAVYGGRLAGARRSVSSAQVSALLRRAGVWTSQTLRANRREDGLYHAYNLMQQAGDGLGLRRLDPMLEGQVAMLASGLLSPQESLDLLRALRSSELYRADQHSYLLYPDRKLAPFLERGLLPAGAEEGSAALRRLLAIEGQAIVLADGAGRLRFGPGMRNADALVEALRELSGSGWDAAADTDQLLALYEAVFDHAAFTGRSMSFFGYEGLGSIYWHMVSKLILAVQGVYWRAEGECAEELRAAYRDLRAGLGTHKDAASYGAFPSDPYSHTPAGKGAKQPGLTGQVKEDFLCRMGELGVQVKDGRLSLREGLQESLHFLGAAGRLSYFDASGQAQELVVPEGCLAFTLCSVPVVLRQGGSQDLSVTWDSGQVSVFPGLRLDRETSRAIFRRQGRVLRIEAGL